MSSSRSRQSVRGSTSAASSQITLIPEEDGTFAPVLFAPASSSSRSSSSTASLTITRPPRLSPEEAERNWVLERPSRLDEILVARRGSKIIAQVKTLVAGITTYDLSADMSSVATTVGSCSHLVNLLTLIADVEQKMQQELGRRVSTFEEANHYEDLPHAVRSYLEAFDSENWGTVADPDPEAINRLAVSLLAARSLYSA